MVMTFIFALAKKLKVSPKDFAQAAVDVEMGNYLGHFTAEYANATIMKMMEKKKKKTS